jgi:hypothetical protein
MALGYTNETPLAEFHWLIVDFFHHKNRPVGILAAQCAQHRGASKVILIDQASRLISWIVNSNYPNFRVT